MKNIFLSIVLFLIIAGSSFLSIAGIIIIDADETGVINVSDTDTVIITKGATVTGNAFIDGGTLKLEDASKIKGKVDIKNQGEVFLDQGSEIEGSVTIKSNSLLTIFGNSSVTGNISVNSGNIISIDGNIVGNISVENSFVIGLSRSSVLGNIKVLKSEGIFIQNSSVSGKIDFINSNRFIIDQSTIGLKVTADSTCFSCQTQKEVRFTGSVFGGFIVIKSMPNVHLEELFVQGKISITGSDNVFVALIQNVSQILIKNGNSFIVDNSVVNGKVFIENCSSAEVTDNIIAGNLTLTNTLQCTESGNIVGGTNSGCSCLSQGKVKGTIISIITSSTGQVRADDGRIFDFDDPLLKTKGLNVGDRVCFDIVLIKGVPLAVDLQAFKH